MTIMYQMRAYEPKHDIVSELYGSMDKCGYDFAEAFMGLSENATRLRHQIAVAIGAMETRVFDANVCQDDLDRKKMIEDVCRHFLMFGVFVKI